MFMYSQSYSQHCKLLLDKKKHIFQKLNDFTGLTPRIISKFNFCGSEVLSEKHLVPDSNKSSKIGVLYQPKIKSDNLTLSNCALLINNKYKLKYMHEQLIEIRV